MEEPGEKGCRYKPGGGWHVKCQGLYRFDCPMRPNGSHFCAYICSLFLVYVTAIERCYLDVWMEVKGSQTLLGVYESFVQHS